MNANRQWPLSISRNVLASLANIEIAVGGWPNNRAQLLRVALFPDTSVITTADNGYIVHLVNKGTAGTASTTLATFTSSTAAGTLAAYVPISLTMSTTASLIVAEDAVLTWKQTTVGANPNTVAAGVVRIEYTLF